MISNLTVYLNHMDFAIGGQGKRRRWGLKNLKTGLKDHCFFLCLASFQNPDEKNINRLETLALELSKKFKDGLKRPFEGVLYSELGALEILFGVGVQVYQIKNQSAILLRRANPNYGPVMNLDLKNKHFDLITDFNLYSRTFSCTHCGKFFEKASVLKVHQRSIECEGITSVKYKSGLFQP